MASVFVVCAAGLLSIHLLSGPGQAGPPSPTTQVEVTSAGLPPSAADEPAPTSVVAPDPDKPKGDKRPPADLGSAVARAVRAGGSASGVGVLVLDTGNWRELAAADADRQFRSASLVKLLIAIDAMQSGVSSNSELRTMLAASHDGIANQLWVETGGNAMVQRQARKIGLSRTAPPLDPMHWGDTKVTARDMGKVYRHVLTELPKTQREVIVGALAAAPKLAADGFDQHFGIPYGLPEVQWAIKQGWAQGRAGVDLHTSGLLAERSRVVVLLSTHAPGTGYSRAAKSLTAGAAELGGLF
ncbi:hypothetical protein GCM10010452_19420 [Crossiella cryophila]